MKKGKKARGRLVVARGGPYDGETLRLTTGVGTLAFRVAGGRVGHYDDKGVWR